MTARQKIEQEISELFNGISGVAADVAGDNNTAGTDIQHYVLQIEQLLESLTKNKLPGGKIFVANYGETVIVESTVPLDVISVNLTSVGGSAKLQKESLVPLSEQDFLEVISDTLAEQIQQGIVSPFEINTKIK